MKWGNLFKPAVIVSYVAALINTGDDQVQPPIPDSILRSFCVYFNTVSRPQDLGSGLSQVSGAINDAHMTTRKYPMINGRVVKCDKVWYHCTD